VKVRVQKIIANAGICSRRKAEELINQKRVKINGEVAMLGDKADIAEDIITVDEQKIKYKKFEYYIINKPKQTICAVDDPHGRRMVVELINSDKRLFTVGRLDYDTTGLIIVTNDGEFSQSITSPDSKIFKTYIAKLDKDIKTEHIIALKNGVKLDDGYVTQKARARKLKVNNEKAYVQLSIQEGKYHQIKKMFAALGYKVEKLTRTKIGNLSIDSVGVHKSGEYVKIRKDDLMSRIK
jgi:23S rRNA pseudouridine2605 synthase